MPPTDDPDPDSDPEHAVEADESSEFVEDAEQVIEENRDLLDDLDE